MAAPCASIREAPEDWDATNVERLAAFDEGALSTRGPLVHGTVIVNYAEAIVSQAAAEITATDEERAAAQELVELRRTRDGRMRAQLGDLYDQANPAASAVTYDNWWRGLGAIRANTVLRSSSLVTLSGAREMTAESWTDEPDWAEGRPALTQWFDRDAPRSGAEGAPIYLENRPRFQLNGFEIARPTLLDPTTQTAAHLRDWNAAYPANLPPDETYMPSNVALANNAAGLRNAAQKGYLLKRAIAEGHPAASGWDPSFFGSTPNASMTPAQRRTQRERNEVFQTWLNAARNIASVSAAREYVKEHINTELLSGSSGVLAARAGYAASGEVGWGEGSERRNQARAGAAATTSDAVREGNILKTATSHFMWRYYEYIMDSRNNVVVPDTGYAIGDSNDPVGRDISRGFLDEVLDTAVELIVNQRLWDQTLGGEVAVESALMGGTLCGDVVNAANGELNTIAQGIWDKGEFERSREFGEEDPLSEAEAGRLARLAEQCFMMDNLRLFVDLNRGPARNPNYFNDQTGESDLIMIQGTTDTIINKLLYDPQRAHFSEFTPAEISSLVPEIRLFKEYVGEDGTVETYEIPFYDHIRSGDPEDPTNRGEIESMMNSTFDRGRGVGLKSFDWRLEGQNPFTARRDIFGELKLYFQSLDEMLRVRSLSGLGRNFRYVDLINIGIAERTGADFDFAWNPDYYRLKVQVGWAYPGGEWGVLSDEKKRAVYASKMILRLTAIDHTFDIAHDGTVNLSINYVAYQEASYLDADSDVLVDEELRLQRLRIREFIARKRREGCSSTFLKDLREKYGELLDRQNYQGWRTLIDRLKARDQIYYFNVCIDTLNEYIQSSAVAETAGLREHTSFDCTPSEIPLLTANSIAPILDNVPSGPTRDDEGEEESLLQQLSSLTYEDVSFVGKPAIQYFYFGDLIQAALSLINASVSPDASAPDVDGRVQAHTGVVGKAAKNLKVLLGPITYVTKEGEVFYNINLADIPISLKYYIDWFLAKAVGSDREYYPVLTFIRDLANTLVSNLMRTECINMQKTNRQNIQLRTNFLTAYAPGGHDVLEQKKNWPPLSAEQQALADEDPELAAQIGSTGTRVDVDTWFMTGRHSRSLLRPPLEREPSYEYMLLYALNSGAVLPLDGYELDTEVNGVTIPGDDSKGIYHFGIGKDRGIFKSVSFTKTEIPGMRESRWHRDFVSELSGLAILANVYEAEIKLFGTTMFVPGMKIFINPQGMAPSIGNPASPNSQARRLGIGGYHVITSVSSYIEGGKYETTVKAIFEAAGAGNDPIITQQSSQAGGTVQTDEAPADCGTAGAIDLLNLPEPVPPAPEE